MKLGTKALTRPTSLQSCLCKSIQYALKERSVFTHRDDECVNVYIDSNQMYGLHSTMESCIVT